jgi:hypothetical protein
MQQSYLGGISAAPAVRPGQSMESAAKGFEETFLAQLVKEMRQTLEPETLFGHDGGDVFGYGAAQNGPGLRRIAGQLGVPYVDRDDGRPISESAPDGGSAQPVTPATTASGVAGRTELYWVFTLLAAVLLLFELFASIRDVRRTRLAKRDVAL